MQYGPYSPSRLDVAVCGYAFHRLYVEPKTSLRKIESLPQARGSAMHLILADLTKEILQSPNPTFTDKKIRDLVASAITQHPAAAQEAGEILRMARGYLLNPPADLLPDAEVEQDFAVKLVGGEFRPCDYDDPEAYARGRADIKMISDDTSYGVIYDHKTQPNIEHADTFQMGFYAWLFFINEPYVDEVRTILHFARYGKYSKPYVWKRGEIRDIEDEIITRIQASEERTYWGPTPNDKCQYCPLIAECPAQEPYLERDAEGRPRPKKGSLKILGDTNKAVELFGVMTVFENLVTEIKRELRAHVEFSQAPIAIPGRRFGFVVKEKQIDWDFANKHQREEIYKIFEKYKVDPKHFMGFSQSFTGKIWQAELPALSRELNNVLRREDSTECRASKV